MSVHRAGAATSVGIPDLTLAHSTAQALPDGSVLVVAARCQWRPEGPDRNAVVVDADGHVTAEATLGDGIAVIRVSRSGDVWVGYFDEGVYGNYGWGGGRQGATPIGDTGLVRFSPDLRPQWRYPRTAMAAWGSINECYVLNVDDDAVWACYNFGHPVVRIADGVVTGWRNPSDRGGQALLVAGERVALCGGGHGPNRDVLLVAGRGANELELLVEYRLVLPDGSPLPATTTKFGRGAELHLFDQGRWYRLDLDDLPQR